MISNAGIISGVYYTLQTTLEGSINDARVQRRFDVQHKENISENAQ
jgi:hypothetical protein